MLPNYLQMINFMMDKLEEMINTCDKLLIALLGWTCNGIHGHLPVSTNSVCTWISCGRAYRLQCLGQREIFSQTILEGKHWP